MRIISLAVAIIFSLPFATFAAKAINVQEGQWETTIKMEMIGMPMAMPPMTTTSCITKKDLVPNTQQPDQKCKVSKIKIKKDSVSWSIKCNDDKGMVMTGAGKIIYKYNVYNGSMDFQISGGGQPDMQMKYTMSGKRIGECKK
ncbi:MAG: DUF3617 family protein [Deltaproteobacteria bacterium]|nr:DUF3617 family protein [Deltaproteobacteria bacterium]